MVNQEKKTAGQIVITREFEEILNLLENTYSCVFITGKAGTGKSTLLSHFIGSTNKNFAVLAPTGVAALNVRGQTIHSFFRFPIGILDADRVKVRKERTELMMKLEMLIIDEVSMVRADLMNAVDIALRRYRKRPYEAFGGVQMVFVGDLFQLPPVVKSDENDHFLSVFGGEYFFYAPAFHSMPVDIRVLTEIFRQSEEDVTFKNLLNNIRFGRTSPKDLELLNSRCGQYDDDHDKSVYLTSRRYIARKINYQKLMELPAPECTYVGSVSGKYEELKQAQGDRIDDRLPAPYALNLRVGAQIMTLRNDAAGRWVNGSIGEVTRIDDDEIEVLINGEIHQVERETWEEIQYAVDPESGKIKENVVGTFEQYPLRLAWAMTIHKSQGKTFEQVVIDIGSGAFAHGQVYVALSRCTTLEGIKLTAPIKERDIIVDQRIIDFMR